MEGLTNNQGNLLLRLFLGNHKMSRSQCLLIRLLRVSIEVLTGFSHVYAQMVSTTHYSLKVASLKKFKLWEGWVECIFQGQGGGKEPLIVRVQLAGQPVVMTA